MWKGIKNWFSCNWPWLLAAAVAALLGFIAANILTGGAVVAALPAIMQIIAAIMIGVALARVTIYIGEYLGKGWAGDISGAAKSLARGFAIGAVELVFALLFDLGAIIKAAKAGLKATAKAAVASLKTSVKTLGRIGAQGAKIVVKNGKIVLKGVGSGLGRGVRSLDDLARRLWKRVRFRKFKIARKGPRVQLWGYINPWVLLADGTIENVTVSGGRPELGELVDVAGRRKPGIIVGVVDEVPSTTVEGLEKLSKNARRKKYRELIDQPQDDIRRVLGSSDTSRNAKELSDNLTAAGKVLKPGDEAHHLVPSTHPRARPAREILEDYNIGINDVPNGLPLSPDLHSGLHTHAYTDEVNRVIGLARSRKQVLEVLDDIAKAILARGTVNRCVNRDQAAAT